jgi:hypothetical protein
MPARAWQHIVIKIQNIRLIFITKEFYMDAIETEQNPKEAIYSLPSCSHVFTLPKAAEQLGIGAATLRKWCSSAEYSIDHDRRGNRVYLRPALVDLINRMRWEPTPPDTLAQFVKELRLTDLLPSKLGAV